MFTKASAKKEPRNFGLEWPLPALTVERTFAIALKMSLLIFQNAKRKFAFAAGTITTRLKAPAIQAPGGFVANTKRSLTYRPLYKNFVSSVDSHVICVNIPLIASK